MEDSAGRPPRQPLTPLRLILIRDHLAGHLRRSSVRWRFAHRVLPLYTPLSGSWLTLAEAVQRLLVRRALAGQHPQSAAEIIQWLEDTVAGWNQAPTLSSGMAAGASGASGRASAASADLALASPIAS